jgi:chemotaxis protein CheX
VSRSLSLAPVLDLNAAASLRTALMERRGESLSLDASTVQRLGGLCLQVLLSAARTWGEDGQTFEIAPRSAAFDEALMQFGVGGRFDDNNLGAC